MSFESGADGAEELGSEVKARFNEQAGEFMGKAMGKGPRIGKVADAMLKELSAAVKEGDAAGQSEMEGALTKFAEVVGGQEQAQKMIGFLHSDEEKK